MRGCSRFKRKWEPGQGLHARGSWCGGRARQKGLKARTWAQLLVAHNKGGSGGGGEEMNNQK